MLSLLTYFFGFGLPLGLQAMILSLVKCSYHFAPNSSSVICLQ